jgi:SnoaL-like polyketide cyclase
MTHDEDHVRDLARSYTDAWCTHDPARVAAHYVPGGTIAINGGDPGGITEVAQSFISAFPDIRVFMDDLVLKDGVVEYHWTFTGTNTGAGGTGKSVRISGFEEWTLSDDGLVASSKGTYDQTEYDRQLEHGAGEPT